MEEIQKQIDGFLLRAVIIKAEMRGHEAGMLIVDQVNESLIFISPKRSYIYEMDYVDNYVNRAAGIPSGQLLWHDYLLKSAKECRREDNPELFLGILQASMKTVLHRAYDIYADGTHLKRVLTWSKAMRYIAHIKTIMRNPVDEMYKSFQNTKRIWVTDPACNTTWFIFDLTYAHYNPYYVELGE